MTCTGTVFLIHYGRRSGHNLGKTLWPIGAKLNRPRNQFGIFQESESEIREVIRVVLGTNVFVSSFFGGNPPKIVDLWKTGEVTICLSRNIINEYIEVLRRLGLQDEGELGELLSLFARGFHSVFTAKTPELYVVDADPDDKSLPGYPLG